jgi:hypothetical protein
LHGAGLRRLAMKNAAIGRLERRLTTIRQLLERDAVCAAIVRYLAFHTDAADTARGIADWWIHESVGTTERALQKLLDRRIVRCHVIQDDKAVFSYTRDPLLRQSLDFWARTGGRFDTVDHR